MKTRNGIRVVIGVLLALFVSTAFADDSAQLNTLTAAEKQAGWKLLFDGKTTAGWRGYKMEKMPPGWQAIDDALVRGRMDQSIRCGRIFGRC